MGLHCSGQVHVFKD
jgi:hypothetical protein